MLHHNTLYLMSFYLFLSCKGCGRHCACSDNAGALPKWWGRRWWSKFSIYLFIFFFFWEMRIEALEVLENVRLKSEQQRKWQIPCVISKKQKCQSASLNSRYASEDERVDSWDSQNLSQTLCQIVNDGTHNLCVCVVTCFCITSWWNTTKCVFCSCQVSL